MKGLFTKPNYNIVNELDGSTEPTFIIVKLYNNRPKLLPDSNDVERKLRLLMKFSDFCIRLLRLLRWLSLPIVAILLMVVVEIIVRGLIELIDVQIIFTDEIDGVFGQLICNFITYMTIVIVLYCLAPHHKKIVALIIAVICYLGPFVLAILSSVHLQWTLLWSIVAGLTSMLGIVAGYLIVKKLES